MDPTRRRRLLRLLLIQTIPPPDITNYQRYVLALIMQLCHPPPDPLLDVRRRLLGNVEPPNVRRNMFELLSQLRYEFFEITGESPETLLQIVNLVELNETRDNILSKTNRVLLIVMWLRSYPTYRMLSCMFGVSTSYVESEIKRSLPAFHDALSTYISWPSNRSWLRLRGRWSKINVAVGAIDGTSHEIYRPVVYQQEFYSGHKEYHCLHTQVIVDNTGSICYVESGFLGHQNDAQTYRLMRQIGSPELPFPDNCILLADKIYPNGHSVMTPYSAAQLRRKNGREKQKCLRYNRFHRKYRVSVEHSIGQIKTYKCVSSVWRNPRRLLSITVKICASLVCRRRSLGLIF